MNRKLKSTFYNFYSSSFIDQLIQKGLYPLIKVPYLTTKKISSPRFPFLIALTIDTEPGYIGRDNLPVWSTEKPDSFEGYIYGIRNWLKLLKEDKIRATFFLSTQCFGYKKNVVKEVLQLLKSAREENHEIGSHLHPQLDSPLQKELDVSLNYGGARFYESSFIKQMLLAQRSLFIKYLGEKINSCIKSFRWGNWGLSTNAIEPLQEAGYEIDSSAIPGILNHPHESLSCDWRAIKSIYPWFLSEINYQNTVYQDSKILEIPITTFSIFRKFLMSDPNTGPLLPMSFKYFYKNADRHNKPFVFVVISHSTEGTYQNGNPTKIILSTKKFLNLARKHADVTFVTLQEAARIIKCKK